MTDTGITVFLKAVQREKSELFASLSNTITAKTKEAAWMRIREELVAGCYPLGKKGWKDLRDQTWAYYKRATLKKYNKSKKLGDGSVRFSEIDELVLAILGRENPAVARKRRFDAVDNERETLEKIGLKLSNHQAYLNILEKEVQLFGRTITPYFPFKVPSEWSRSSRTYFVHSGSHDCRSSGSGA
uniref:Regulatory protein zeste n=1 Tax=Steinernema glaseri TaxID=37863 RepID=A0A1I7Z3M2_9BILA